MARNYVVIDNTGEKLDNILKRSAQGEFNVAQADIEKLKTWAGNSFPSSNVDIVISNAITTHNSREGTQVHPFIQNLIPRNIKDGSPSAALSIRQMNNEATGLRSAAFNLSTAEGAYSFSAGYYTKVNSSSPRGAVVLGTYNIEDTQGELLFTIGNGRDDSHRSNAFTLDINGNAAFAGTVTSNSKTLITEEQVNNKLTDYLKEPSSGIAQGKYFRVAGVTQDGHANLECVDNPVQTDEKYGVTLNAEGKLETVKASDEVITARTYDSFSSQHKPIVPRNLDFAVKAALCDGKGAAYTREEQDAALERFGCENAVRDFGQLRPIDIISILPSIGYMFTLTDVSTSATVEKETQQDISDLQITDKVNSETQKHYLELSGTHASDVLAELIKGSEIKYVVDNVTYSIYVDSVNVNEIYTKDSFGGDMYTAYNVTDVYIIPSITVKNNDVILWTEKGYVKPFEDYVAENFYKKNQTYTKTETDSSITAAVLNKGTIKGQATAAEIDVLYTANNWDIYQISTGGTIHVLGPGSPTFTVGADDWVIYDDSHGWTPLSTVTKTKTTLGATLAEGTTYDLGSSAQASVSFALPQTATAGSDIYVAFKSGSTATILTITGTYLGDTSYTPSANCIVELSFRYICGAWVLVAKETPTT